MTNDIMNTRHHGERVTSTYAEIYMDEEFCDYKKSSTDILPLQPKVNTVRSQEIQQEWKSPSDLLIGILELKPPFTSKITRGITHEGILAIGDDVLATEQIKFVKRVNELVNENNDAWEFILDYEISKIEEKVKKIYDKIFFDKSKIMMKECTKFYEKSLQELEDHLRSEIQQVLVSAYSNIIRDLNYKIKLELKKEKLTLDEVLKKIYHIGIGKIKKYYKLLLSNETYRHTQLYNQALNEKNDALKAFVRQVEAETITSTMYVMCAERKKCKIKQFIVNNYQTLEISEMIKKIKEKQGLLDDFKKKDRPFSYINKQWEDKIKKVTQIFLKFISFSLKLLPEQTTFLLDLEKMVVLQLNELQKQPSHASSILVEDNILKFEKTDMPTEICTKQPFEIVGDTAESIPTSYGSTETIPSDVDLPFIRLQRQYYYAKCHKFEEVKAFLESQKCKCASKYTKKEASYASLPENLSAQVTSDHTPAIESSSESYERISLDDYNRVCECFSKQCQDLAKKVSFPYLDSYLNYSEENFERLKVIFGKPQEKEFPSESLSPKDIVYREVPYAKTKHKHQNVETQYSSQEDLIMNLECNCVSGVKSHSNASSSHNRVERSQKYIDEMMAKRHMSIQRLMGEHPKLLKIFTDECFDFTM